MESKNFEKNINCNNLMESINIICLMEMQTGGINNKKIQLLKTKLNK